jgi:hypothetical protein
MKTFGGVEVWVHILLTSALDGDERSASRPGRIIPDTHWIGGSGVFREGLDAMGKRKIS